MTATVSARDLHALLTGGGEIALLDAREEGVFARRHILRAVPAPLSRLEFRIDALVPRRSCRLVLCDVDDGLAARAAAKLAGFGYSDVAVLEGGIEAWERAGYQLYSGVNVPSKAFGEFVEQAYGTPHIDASDLAARLAAGDDIVVLDSRPFDEYRRMSIPGGIDCPGAELVYRLHDLAPSPATTVVVNCAGRTRSIIGAQSLINAGAPNPVMALANGTMGWHLAGLALEHGAGRRAPEVSEQGLAKARTAAARVAARFGVATIGRSELARFEAERDRRSLFLLDVRHPEEYAAGHLPGSRSAPGGQLVQATDRYVGVLNARLVLIDDDGVRAAMTASWLVQMGWQEVYVLEGGLEDAELEAGPEAPAALGLDQVPAERVTARELKDLLDAGRAVVVDLATSLQYREGHVPGAWFAVRSRFKTNLAKLPAAGMLVLTSPDGALATLARSETEAVVAKPVRTLAGGTAAWTRAGFALEEGQTRMADDNDDAWYRPYDNDRAVEDAMREYLTWEVALAERIERDETVAFKYVPDG
ncbi:MAG: rhodanese-like domain-containing protein [Alphaproteobacteria bacterium]